MKTMILTLVSLTLLIAAPVQAAQINIQAIHLKAKLSANVDAGPAWWPVTGRPGGGDTIAIAGHRTTHTRPFHDLDKLRPGDQIRVRYQNRWHTYRVTSRRIWASSNMHIGDSIGHERLLLTACTRPDGSPTSANWRIVVYALPSSHPAKETAR